MAVGAEDSYLVSLVVSVAAAGVSALVGITSWLISRTVNRIEKALDELEKSLNGRDGTWTQITGFTKWVEGAERRIKGLEDGRLTLERFESETKAQNAILEELKRVQRDTQHKVERVELTVGRVATPSSTYASPPMPPRGNK